MAKKTNITTQTPTDTTQPSFGTTPGGAATNVNDVLSALKKMAFSQGNVVSSQSTGFEKAIANVQKAGDLSGQQISSQADRQIATQTDLYANQRTSMLEGRRGYATNMAALNQLDQQTNKNLADLEQRKQELLLSGEANTARQIAQMQVQQIQFKTQAQQKVFSNLLNIGSFENSINQQTIKNNQFDQQMKYNESSAMSQIALKYGLTTQPGETLTSLYSRATQDMGTNSPAALAIKEAKSTIDSNNASVSASLQRIQKDKAMSSIDSNVIARAIIANPQQTAGILAQIKDPTKIAEILTITAKSQFNTSIEQQKSQGITKADLKAQYIADNKLSASDKASALKSIETIYGPDSKQPIAPVSQPVTLPSILGNIYTETSNFGRAGLNFITGQNLK